MDDRQIVALYHERDETAITETQSKYGARLRAVSMNLVFDRLDAEECVNDTYMKAWNSMPPERPSRLFAFLARITRNISMHRLDYRSAKKRNALICELSNELMECIPNPSDGMDEYKSGSVAEIISDFLGTVDETAQALFVRRYWYGDSIRELAQSCGLSESGVKSKLFRTRNKLREVLQEEGISV